MKKILFIIFTENSNFGVSMLCALANKHGWSTDIYFIEPEDVNINKEENYNKLKEFIINYKPDIISFSFKSFERNQALDVAKFINNLNVTHWNNYGKILKIIAGGIHPTLMPDEIMETGLFDAVVVGDGMGILEEILNTYESLNRKILYGKQHSDKNVYTNFFYSKNQIERMKNTETATVLTTIGCPYECTFCHSGNQTFFPLPIKNVAKYIIELYENYGVRNFHFLDDLFAYNLKRLQEFNHIIKEHNTKILFSSQVSCRVDKFNEEIAKEFVSMGVETVNFGVETVSFRLLQFLNKKHAPNECYEAVNLCHKYELNCTVNLMFGIPTQNKYDYDLSLDFIKTTNPDSVNCFIYTPYPGTDLYDFCFRYNYISNEFNPNKFDWFKPNLNGINTAQFKLNKVDYELANDYIKKINKVLDEEKDKLLFEKMKVIDSQPWILIGTTRHYYFIKLIKKLSKTKWNNFLGYINIDKDAGFYVNENLNPSKVTKPFWFVTYAFLNGTDFKNLEKYIEKKYNPENNEYYNNIPLISISSFKKSHSVKDIEFIERIHVINS